MCVMVDANVRDSVFGNSRTPASELFLESIDSRFHKLVVGGKLTIELAGAQSFKTWLVQARLAQRVREIPDSRVVARTNELIKMKACKSDDPHVIALAQESGCRLLFTNEPDLQQDFNNHSLIANPRGRVYTTLRHQDIRKSHRDLLARRDLCAWNDCGK